MLMFLSPSRSLAALCAIVALTLLSGPVAAIETSGDGYHIPYANGTEVNMARSANAVGIPSIDPTVHDRFGVRVERVKNASTGDAWSSTRANAWVPIPMASATFVAHESSTNVAITFSAEAYTSTGTKRMFVRALVDGVAASPGDVVFTEGAFRGARAFTFGFVTTPGTHTVEMQWQVDSPERAYLRSESLLVRAGRNGAPGGSLVWQHPPGGANASTSSPVWTDMPGTSLPFTVTGSASTMIVFGSECFVSTPGASMFVRALVDNVPVSPSDVLFTREASRGVRSMSFGVTGLAVGNHTAKIQWLAQNGGAFAGDRTLVVSSYPSVSGTAHELVAAPSGPSLLNNLSTWSAVPNLSKSIYIPENGEIAATFSGEVVTSANARLEMRLKVGSTASATDIVELGAQNGASLPSVQTFTFDMKHRNSSGAGQVKTASLEWRAIDGNVWLGDRTLSLFVEEGAIPDLAEAPPFGLGLGGALLGSPIEAAIGARKLLTILLDPNRPEFAAPSLADVTLGLFGPHGVADYFTQVSGGRFTVQNVGVIGWFDTAHSASHYWTHGDCNDPASDGFTGGHQERWVEALQHADATIDFASFDTNRDGTVSPRELGILLLTPQKDAAGFVRTIDPYCNGSAYITDDGVRIGEIAEWFTLSPEYYMSGAAHELAHHLLGLSDMYVNNLDSPTEPGKMSLMGDQHATTAHIDPVNKLALGWVTPRTIWNSADVSLTDVKWSREVLILPRRVGGDGAEYFVIENRQHEATDSNAPHYDESGYGNGNQLYIDRGHGLAIWHVIEDSAKSAKPPPCLSQTVWDSFGSANARRGIRLLNPQIAHPDNSDYLWSSLQYDLDDGAPLCPSTDDDPTQRRNVLLWADGTPSGYAITNVSAFGNLMTFHVSTP